MPLQFNTPQMVARVRAGAQRGVLRATNRVRSEMVSLILETPKTGRIYRRRGVTHQASAPGELPASDTGYLVNRIRADFGKLGQLVGEVVVEADYAEALEYGTRNMAPRPFARPALANTRGRVADDVAEGIRAALAGP